VACGSGSCSSRWGLSAKTIVDDYLHLGELSGENAGMGKSSRENLWGSASFWRGAAFVEGDYVPIAEAKISILDTGFSRSDVTYDVVAVWNGAFFRLDDHVERFERNCAALRMQLPFDRMLSAVEFGHAGAAGGGHRGVGYERRSKSLSGLRWRSRAALAGRRSRSG
jgi:hypothetical protein